MLTGRSEPASHTFIYGSPAGRHGGLDSTVRIRLAQHLLHELIDILTLALFTDAHSTRAQTSAAAAQNASPLNFSLSVDEVILTFHARTCGV